MQSLITRVPFPVLIGARDYRFIEAPDMVLSQKEAEAALVAIDEAQGLTNSERDAMVDKVWFTQRVPLKVYG
jgi:hypothetical protein